MRIHQKGSEIKMLLSLCVILTLCNLLGAFPASEDDSRYPDKEYASPGVHQLASWLTSQLRRNDYAAQIQDVPVLSYRAYRLSGTQGKRNSELTNSMMGIPRNMIDNGKK